MKKITIEGKFTGSVNNRVVLDVFRSNTQPKPFDFKKAFDSNFKEVLSDLHPGLSYNIDLSGFTTGTFDLKISGDFEGANPITRSFTNKAFSPGFRIRTNSEV